MYEIIWITADVTAVTACVTITMRNRVIDPSPPTAGASYFVSPIGEVGEFKKITTYRAEKNVIGVACI